MHDSLRTDSQGSTLPALLTVAEAARELRIGRTLAYQLAAAFEAGDLTGLPVIRLGNCLRVPRWALDQLIRHGRVITDVYAMTSGESSDRHATPSSIQMLDRRIASAGKSRSTTQLLLERTEPPTTLMTSLPSFPMFDRQVPAWGGVWS